MICTPRVRGCLAPHHDSSYAPSRLQSPAFTQEVEKSPTTAADKGASLKTVLEAPTKLQFFLISKPPYETEDKRRTKRSFRGT